MAGINLGAVDLNMVANSLLLNAVDALLAVVVIAVVAVAGWLVAVILNKIIVKALEAAKFEEHLSKIELTKALRGFTATGIITAVVKVYVLLAFLGAGAAVIQLDFLSAIMMDIISYIPMLVQGVLIIIGAIAFMYYVDKLIGKMSTVFAKPLSIGAKVLMTYVALVIALPLVLPNVDTAVLTMILTYGVLAIVVAFGLGLGLAIGLGLKEPIAIAGKKNQVLFDAMFQKVKK